MTTALKYTILPGDTLSDLAKQLNECAGVTWQEIAEANPSVDPRNLQVGQVINIPANQTDSASNPVVTSGDETIAYYAWTWSSATPPVGANMGIAFSGWVDPCRALEDSSRVYDSLVGQKVVSLGGGNESGSWNSTAIQTVIQSIQNGDFSKYQGICYDIEEGAAGLENDFSQLFQTTKAHNLIVFVTVSHSAPYGISDAPALMESFFENEDIDYLSPQLYTTGKETENDYDISQVPWKSYASAKAAIVPSIVQASFYESAQQYFANVGVVLKGFVQWSQS